MATAKENDAFTKSLLPNYPLDDAIDWIQGHLQPQEVFNQNQLDEWAESNGYTLKDSQT